MNQPLQTKADIHTFDASHVESLIAEGNWNACWDYLGGLINNLTITSSGTSYLNGIALQKDMKDETVKKYVNDFGALVGELFLFLLTEDSVALSDHSFQKLIYAHETLHTLFYICNLHETDSLVRNLISSKQKISSTQQKKLLLLLSLDTQLDLNEILCSVDVSYRKSALISYFSHRKIFRERTYHNKVQLLSLRHYLDKAHENFTDFLNVTNAYFLCSYMNSPDKHKLKENLNTAVRNHLMESIRNQKRAKNQPRDLTRLKLDETRPTVLVIAELFAKGHAMNRCYGERVQALQKEFNVVLAMPTDSGDPRLKFEYENYVLFLNLGEFFKVLHDVKPDIIFLPSVGMRLYSIIAANIREAPIQIASLGHPATTMSERIDYVMGPSDLYDERAFPTDIYIGDGPARPFLPLFSKEKFFEEITLPPRLPNTIKVAVVGTDIKVSYPFFRLLKEIVEQAPFKIHVSFMMGVGGIDSLYLEKFLQENFENSSYTGWQDYGDYINSIKSVDVVMNPFPFGHTNTVIDTLMCGIPCIGLEGIEPASKTEAHVLRAAGLEDDFVAKDEEDYKNKFFAIAEKIINGDNNFFDREKVYEAIFQPHADQDYGKLIKWIYDNNENLKSSGKKYIEMFEDV
ncbi:MAG: hypothetical protein DI586_08065 [Micavibrio aeruginosavorus]|uniref:O-GlcNAc transferase C-terminal domain-containing protein n=1 Tax=Micavibrio aeruginosavorus TaxID=349221 RepID=A0A2W5HML9_9BACT|nr:MAG: hypothetical protein DI586_08065 [Micavibrio aeruginosavorus]